MMKRVVVWPNPLKDTDLSVTKQVVKQLQALEVDIVFLPSAVTSFEVTEVPLPELFLGADMVVVIGGDGTILQCAQHAAPHNVPLLGVNMGRLGFMTELEPSEIHRLTQVVRQEYQLDCRMMLDVTVRHGEEILHHDVALNDAVLSGDATARVIEVSIATDHELITSFHGDGVVISTPTGSTAYALSAGGPIIEPQAQNIAITPICPHDFLSRTLLLSPGRTVQVMPLYSRGYGTFLTVDGRTAVPVHKNQTVHIKRSALICPLIRVKNRNFYNIVTEKLGRH